MNRYEDLETERKICRCIENMQTVLTIYWYQVHLYILKLFCEYFETVAMYT